MLISLTQIFLALQKNLLPLELKKTLILGQTELSTLILTIAEVYEQLVTIIKIILPFLKSTPSIHGLSHTRTEL